MNYNLKIACSKGNLKDIRSFVNDSLKDLAIPELEISMLVLAIDEVCANLIIHSNNCDENNFLEISIRNESNGIVFEIADSGKPFDPNIYPAADLKKLIQEKKKGGVGLTLVKQIVDSIELIDQDKFTVYRLYKRISIAPC